MVLFTFCDVVYLLKLLLMLWRWIFRLHRSTTYVDAAHCRNGLTDRGAICFVDLGGPKEAYIRWRSDPRVIGKSDRTLGLPATSCAEMAEPIEMPFGLWTWVGPRKDVGCTPSTIWQIPLNRPCAAAMRHFCQIILITCYVIIRSGHI